MSTYSLQATITAFSRPLRRTRQYGIAHAVAHVVKLPVHEQLLQDQVCQPPNNKHCLSPQGSLGFRNVTLGENYISKRKIIWHLHINNTHTTQQRAGAPRSLRLRPHPTSANERVQEYYSRWRRQRICSFSPSHRPRRQHHRHPSLRPRMAKIKFLQVLRRQKHLRVMPRLVLHALRRQRRNRPLDD